MGKRIFFGLATAALIALCGLVPKARLAQVPQVSIAKPTVTQYTGEIYCRGELVSSSAREVTLELPLVLQDVQVRVGDTVTAGQVLAQVDPEATMRLLTDQVDLSYLNLSSLLGEYGSKELVQKLESYLQEKLAEYETAVPLDDIPSQIVAPIDGVVTAVTAQNGTAVTPLQPAFTITPDDSMLAVMQVGEGDIGNITEGQPAKVEITALEGHIYDATVLRIAPAATKVFSGTSQETVVEVTLRIDNPDSLLKSGYSARASIQTQETETVYLAPYEAVRQDDAGNEYVYVYQNGLVSRHYIETGVELAEGVRVLGGINIQDYLITEPDKIAEDAQFVFLHK